MKKILSFRKLVAFFTALFFTVNSYAVNFWMPATIFISPTGAISHTFPIPTTGSPGQAFGSSSVGLAGFFPVPIAGITKFKRIYALEGKVAGPSEMVQQSDGIFVAANNPSGYRVIEKQDVTLGINLTAVVGLVSGWMGLGFAGGVTTVYGKGYLANRWAPTLQDANNLMNVQVPVTLAMARDYWKVGDSLTTTKSGSISFNAGLGVMGGALAAVGIGGSLSSTWNTGIAFLEPATKGGAPLIKLVYSKEKGSKVGVNVGNIVGGFNLDKAWGKSESFEYIFDLANPGTSDLVVESYLKGSKISKDFKGVTILQAYQEALGGNLIFADLLSNMKGKGVVKVTEAQKKSKSTTLSGSTTLPWLFTASFNIGKSFTGGRTKVFGDEQLLEELIGVYSKQSATEGIISNDMKRISTFAGNFQQVSPLNELDGQIQRRYSGSYKYYFVQNNVKADKFEEELRKLRYKIGFMKELKGVPVPQGNIGTLEVDLDVTLSNVATDELMKLAKQFPEDVFVKEAQDYVDGFFKGVKDAKEEICESYRVRVLQECIFTTKRQSAAAMKTAFKALQDMSKFRSDMNFKAFVQAYADFGKGFIENRFTMKTFLRMLRNEFNPGATGEAKFGKEKLTMVDGKMSKIPYEIVLSIKGTNLAPYKQVLYTYK
jgi:hypothetical protein